MASAVMPGDRRYGPPVDYWHVIGTLLQIIGLLLAMSGLAQTYREVMQRSVLRDMTSDFQRWWRRVVLGRPGQGVGVGVSAFGGARSSGYATSTPFRKPPPGAATEAKVDYLMKMVDALANEDRSIRTALDAGLRAADEDQQRRLAEVEERLGGELSKMRTAFVGRDGAGLRQAAAGLGVTLVGVTLTLA